MTDIAAGFIGLKDLFANRVSQVGVEVIRTAIDQSTVAYAAAFDQLIRVLTGDLPDNTKVQERYRLPASGTLQPVDEWGRPKPVQGEQYYTQAYPLKMAATAWGDSWVAMAKMTVQEANDHTLAATRADADWNIRHILAALFYNSNWTFADDEHGDLTIYPMAANESTVKYLTRTGQLVTFNAYRAQASAIDATHNPLPTIKRDLQQFPVNAGPLITYIHNDQRASIEALAGFVEISDPDITVGSGSDTLTGRIPTDHLGDEMIGKCNGHWIAEWGRMPSGYMLSLPHGNRILARRQQPERELQGFIKREVEVNGVKQVEWHRHAGYAPRIRCGAIITRIGNATYEPPSGYDVAPLPI